MRQTSELYKQLREQAGYYYDVKIVCGNAIYGVDKLKSITIEQAMFEGNGPQIGGVYSSQCKVELLEESENWPRAASFEVFIRITDGIQTDDWMSMGVYYTDERHADKHGNLELIAFDSMLTLEQPWTDNLQNPPDSWPITAKAACDYIQEALGIQYDERNALDDTVPFIGLDTTSTARETLATIAAGLGGNWHVTPEGKLRLIPLYNHAITKPAIPGIAVTGVSVVGTSENDYNILQINTAAREIETGDHTDAIAGVVLTTSKGTSAGTNIGEGYVLQADCDWSDSNVANLCFNRLYGYRYKSYAASAARLDPSAELGDFAVIDEDQYPIISITWKLGRHITADISAPYEETIDHEYNMVSKSAKMYRKAVNYADRLAADAYSAIEQSAESIRTTVSASYVNNDELNTVLRDYSPTEEIEAQFATRQSVSDLDSAVKTQFSQTEEGFNAAIATVRKDTSGQIEVINSYVRYGLIQNPENPDDPTDTVYAVTVGKDGEDNKTSVRITNDGIYLCYGDRYVSKWDQDEQLSPKALRVPVGGKLTIGSILFQPRSSGNMSLMWVGQNAE